MWPLTSPRRLGVKTNKKKSPPPGSPSCRRSAAAPPFEPPLPPFRQKLEEPGEFKQRERGPGALTGLAPHCEKCIYQLNSRCLIEHAAELVISRTLIRARRLPRHDGVRRRAFSDSRKKAPQVRRLAAVFFAATGEAWRNAGRVARFIAGPVGLVNTHERGQIRPRLRLRPR
ncbi:hypothetical protein SKAU_G00066280 [Synaphobranchus kaupii]|uniref:Uncharacterized protein n=1 Tax=Synaphobranchus kaupii TaxID=118154 RepID=A0A9Q1G6R0_SYNKA|nr:hypothetical protein SKAU_G00066280 [Synaphobranchus kaupii]